MNWAQALLPPGLQEELMAEAPSKPDPTQERPTEQPAEIKNLLLIAACGCGSGCGCGCQSGSPCQCG
ncbi:hypothetical protein [Streptomyces sp. NPDC057052]|uniref:hypothetical protein n=2 Tax=Streptomyces TaxID=1883 RepID=UPI00363B5E81